MKRGPCVLVSLLFCGGLYAAEFTGKAFGEDGKPLSGVEIRLHLVCALTKTNAQYFTKSQSDGSFKLTNVLKGSYLLFFNKWGYSPNWKRLSVNTESSDIDCLMRRYAVPKSIDSVELFLVDNRHLDKTNVFPMEQNASGVWEREVSLQKGKYRYGYRINGEVLPYVDIKATHIMYNGFGDYICLKQIDSPEAVRFSFCSHDYPVSDDRFPLDDEDWFGRKLLVEKAVKYAIDGDDFLLEKVKSNKIVFFSEGHRESWEIEFLTKNLQKLYDEANLRYLFIEKPLQVEATNYRPGDLQGWIQINYAWQELYSEINRINEAVKEPCEKLRLIFAEEDLNFNIFENISYPSIEGGKAMNARDKSAFIKITNTLQNAREQDKAIVFYGGCHGLRVQYGNTGGLYPVDFPYTNIARYLMRYYGNRFYNIDEYTYDTHLKYPYDLPMIDAVLCSKIPADIYGFAQVKVPIYQVTDAFDAFIYCKKQEWCMPSCFINTETTTDILMDYLCKWLEYLRLKRPLNWDAEWAIDPEFASTMYLLKLFYGEHFKVDYWNPKVPVEQSVAEFTNWIRKNKSTIRFDGDKEVQLKKEYYFQFIRGGWAVHEGYPFEGIPFLIRAGKLIPGDLYSDYNLLQAYKMIGETAKAVEAGERLLNNENICVFMYLPDVYSNLSDCYLRLSNRTDYERIQEKLQALKPAQLTRKDKLVSGVFVSIVSWNSVAAKVFRFGDIITKYNRQTVSSPEEFNKLLVMDPNTTVEIEFLRGDKTMKINAPGGKLGLLLF